MKEIKTLLFLDMFYIMDGFLEKDKVIDANLHCDIPVPGSTVK
jgi:hypothetical protein